MSQDKSSAATDVALTRCLNCAAALHGQYCGQCGQRARGRLISVWELLRDAFGDLLDVDSRLWRTLYLLVLRPGRLTDEYLRGRRARYMPPFRTYLVLSLLFFFVAFFDSQDFGILFEPADEADVPVRLTDEDRRELLDELSKEGIIASPGVDELAPGERTRGFRFNLSEDGAECSIDGYDPGEMPGWLGRRLTKERMQDACRRLTAEDGSGLQGFLQRLVELIPAGLFVLLPLTALVLKLLYPLSRRFYVEHLLMVINYHSFVFLALTAQAFISRTGTLLQLSNAWMTIVLSPVVIYVPVYLYKTMRRVYGQGHWLTSLKFLLLCLAYATGMSMILLVVVLFAVFQA